MSERSFGPGEERHAHAPNEHNTIDQLERCVAFYAAWPATYLETVPPHQERSREIRNAPGER